MTGVAAGMVILESSPRWAQLTAIVTSIVSPAILSAKGLLSKGYLVAAIGTPLVMTAKISMSYYLHKFLNRLDTSITPIKYKKFNLLALLIHPIGEEIFCAVIQSVSKGILENKISNSEASILGLKLSKPALGSILIASSVFGAMHYFNPGANSDISALLAVISGIFYRTIAHQYGLYPAIFAHYANNAIAQVILNINSYPYRNNVLISNA